MRKEGQQRAVVAIGRKEVVTGCTVEIKEEDLA